jgi:hypothetical protein
MHFCSRSLQSLELTSDCPFRACRVPHASGVKTVHVDTKDPHLSRRMEDSRTTSKLPVFYINCDSASFASNNYSSPDSHLAQGDIICCYLCSVQLYSCVSICSHRTFLLQNIRLCCSLLQLCAVAYPCPSVLDFLKCSVVVSVGLSDHLPRPVPTSTSTLPSLVGIGPYREICAVVCNTRSLYLSTTVADQRV